MKEDENLSSLAMRLNKKYFLIAWEFRAAFYEIESFQKVLMKITVVETEVNIGLLCFTYTAPIRHYH